MNRSGPPTGRQILPPTGTRLRRNEVHLWCVSLDRSLSALADLRQTLTQEETSRATRYFAARDRDRFVVSRAFLRKILSRYLDAKPEQVQFRYGSHGKPALVAGRGGHAIRFNLAHSHNLALYTVARERRVGVDLERVRPISDAERIAERFFCRQEYASIRALPRGVRQQAFYHYWTCKEALAKATGYGLSLELDQVEVSLAPGEPVRLLQIGGDEHEASRWRLYVLTPAPGYIGALAVEGHAWRLAGWRWPEWMGEAGEQE